MLFDALFENIDAFIDSRSRLFVNNLVSRSLSNLAGLEK
jgi:hypothetical protein